MRDIVIITDSSSDLTDEYINKNNIVIIHIELTVGPETFFDRTLTSVEFFDKLKKYNTLAKTHAITIDRFIGMFKGYIEDDKDIIYISIGSKFSSTYNNAILASQEFDPSRIEVIDSANLCLASGSIVKQTVKYKNDGLEFHELASRVRSDVIRCNLEFVVETLEFLHKGGRCGGLAYHLGTILNIKPIIKLRDGELSLDRKKRGKIKQGVEELLKYFIRDFENDNIVPDTVYIAEALNMECAEHLQKLILNKTGILAPIERIGTVISSHCGKGTVGFTWITKN